MKLSAEWVEYETPTGTVSAYLVRTASAGRPTPGVIVIQEVWGVDEHMQDIAERLTGAGYTTLTPDLYSRGGARPESLQADRVKQAKAFLDTIPSEQWMAVLGDERLRRDALERLPSEQGAAIGETLGTLFGGPTGDPSRHVPALRASFSFLRSHPACGGRAVGSVGFCMGGGLSALLACTEPELGGAVIFYGASPSDEQVGSIRCPLRGFYGRNDPRIIDGLPRFARALTAAEVEHELRIYPGAGHAFLNDTRPSYQQEAARDAWAGTLAFFAAVLDPVSALPPEGLGVA